MPEYTNSYDVGTATVELTAGLATVGDSLDVEVRTTDRRGDTTVESVTLALETRYRTEDGYRTATLDRTTLATDLGVESGVTETQTTTVTVPRETPGTVGGIDVWARITVDAGDETVERRRFLDVNPTDDFHAVLDATTDLGFTPRAFACQADDAPEGGRFVRRIDARPTGGPFADQCEELALFVRTASDGLELSAAIDPDADDVRPVPRGADAWTVFPDSERTVTDCVRSLVERRVADESDPGSSLPNY